MKSEFDAGYFQAKREISLGRWTPQQARCYLDQCRAVGAHLVNGRSEFDCGFMKAVHELAGRAS